MFSPATHTATSQARMRFRKHAIRCHACALTIAPCERGFRSMNIFSVLSSRNCRWSSTPCKTWFRMLQTYCNIFATLSVLRIMEGTDVFSLLPGASLNKDLHVAVRVRFAQRNNLARAWNQAHVTFHWFWLGSHDPTHCDLGVHHSLYTCRGLLAQLVQATTSLTSSYMFHSHRHRSILICKHFGSHYGQVLHGCVWCKVPATTLWTVFPF